MADCEFTLSGVSLHRATISEADKESEAYLYRNLPDGEKHAYGAWSDAEKAAFLAHVKEFRPTGKNWGLFSKTIRGRAGYQCKRFYEELAAAGEVEPIKSSRRMAEPWKAIEASGNTEELIKFPDDPLPYSQPVVEEEAFEYQVSKIMRMNADTPLNFLLLSFPVDEKDHPRVMHNIRNRLAHKIDQKKLDDLVTDYFAVTGTSNYDESQRKQRKANFVKKVLSECVNI